MSLTMIDCYKVLCKHIDSEGHCKQGRISITSDLKCDIYEPVEDKFIGYTHTISGFYRRLGTGNEKHNRLNRKDVMVEPITYMAGNVREDATHIYFESVDQNDRLIKDKIHKDNVVEIKIWEDGSK